MATFFNRLFSTGQRSQGGGSKKVNKNPKHTLNRVSRCCPSIQGEDFYPQVTDDQPRNPYTEVTVLSGHMAAVHHIEVIDHSRYVLCMPTKCQFNGRI